MKPLHKIALVCTTFVLAAATGHVMQNSVPEGQMASPVPSASEPVTLQQARPAARSEVHLAEAALAPPPLPRPEMRGPAVDAALGPLPEDSPAQSHGFAKPACAEPQLRGEPAPGGSVLLTVSAPCEAGQKAEIRHEGLRLPIQLSAEGGWQGIVPAFAPEALFLLRLDRIGLPPMVTVTVPEVADYNRIAVITAAQTGVQLHGYEYGAEPGSIGDVWQQAPRTPDTRNGGWMASYSVPGEVMAVQIYSAPIAMSDIDLVLDAPVTEKTCGQNVTGVVLRKLGKGSDDAMLAIAMPDCGDGEGSVLMQLPEFPLSVAEN
ncbi:hypothetical protein C8J30_10271 [Rhodobacter viridis]|uniref:Secreted protein n=1 Tax=Rhodobacter viridis TaxID=1054202 RepID=A0A318U2G3_9RHOB|nr:hypothetical protein [Rhodobacter viridis]PYF11761.1 hypothetical protein C8J30_10271 [Rhodobacter viridis]